MTDLTTEDYIALLKGENRGKHFSQNYFTIKRKKNVKTTQKNILLNEKVGLPAALNEEYNIPEKPKKKKRKHQSIDPAILRLMG